MTSGQPVPDPVRMRALLVNALRGESAHWPDEPPGSAFEQRMPGAILYHGVAGLLVGKLELLRGWPDGVLAGIRDQARAIAMWELRHREVLRPLLQQLAERGVRALAMKGSALACDLYPQPAQRPRGDTDLLVDPDNVAAARTVLADLGFRAASAGQGLEWLQQSWSLSCPDGTSHAIDLHWAVFNAPALARVLPVAECVAGARPLPALAPAAKTMDPARTMIHLCLHRALHVTAPYLVGEEANFGGDRLIWSFDIHLLASRLEAADWSLLTQIATERGVAGACLDGLRAAGSDLGTRIPANVESALARSAPGDLPYFRKSRSLARAWQDLRAMPGMGSKARYLSSRLLPDGAFLRAKYPGTPRAPLPLLYLRRLVDALRSRS